MHLHLLFITVATLLLVGLLVAALWYQQRRKTVLPPLLGPGTRASSEEQRITTMKTWGDDIVGEPRILTLDEAVPASKTTPPVPPTAATVARSHSPFVAEDSGHWIVFHVLARPGHSFIGYDLVQALLAAGMQHGATNLFHYYQPGDQSHSQALFSLASALKPGTFQLDQMGAFSTTGLTLFMDINCPQPMYAYTHLLEVIQRLADDLPGKICDDQRRPCTQAYLEKCHARILRAASATLTVNEVESYARA